MTEKSFERGHSWNVNTQKESSILRSSGLCHASIFLLLLFFFLCVFLWGRQKMELYNCTVICSGPLCFVRPCGLPFDRVMSLGNASVISTPTITHPFFCVCVCEIPLCVFPPSGGGKSWIMIRAFVPLDCVVAVADVGLLCWESWKRRMRGAIESPAESRLIIVTYEMRQAGAYIWTCFLSLTSVTYGIMAENECSGAVLSSCCSVAETIIISINSWDSSYISTLYYLHQRASVKPAAHPSTTSTSTTLSFNYQASTFQLSPQTV